MPDSEHVVIEFVLEKCADEPVRRRIVLYKALADFCGDALEAKQLEALARGLEQAEAAHREFAFNFSQKAGKV